VIAPACFVAETNGQVLGGILITLIPKREPGEWWDGIWREPPLPDAAALGLGRAHLTWVFVAPILARQGIGSILLAHAVNALVAQGFPDLASTFLVGNEVSTLWHWRNGFRLMPYPGAMRSISNLL
jgi:ribosomal protein S18 acetylase RimI-like enzyme